MAQALVQLLRLHPVLSRIAYSLLLGREPLVAQALIAREFQASISRSPSLRTVHKRIG
jgi:hypothetical protein